MNNIEILPVEVKDTNFLASYADRSYGDSPIYPHCYKNPKKLAQYTIDMQKFRIKGGAMRNQAFKTSDGRGHIIFSSPDHHMGLKSLLKTGGVSTMLRYGLKSAKAMMNLVGDMRKVSSSTMKEEYWDIGPITVDPDFQNKGYGSALIKKVLDIVDENNGISYLTTQADDAVRLYERFGFEVIHSGMDSENVVPIIAMVRPRQNKNK